MQAKLLKFIFLLLLSLLPVSATALEMNSDIKGSVRNIFSQFAVKLPLSDFGKLPEGLEIIDGKGYRGIRIKQGKLIIRVHTWLEDVGLLETHEKCRKEEEESGAVTKLVASVNGVFYSPRGVLGQVISDAALPRGILQIPGVLSRCFIASLLGAKERQFWYIGETSMKAHELFDPYMRSKAWFNTPTVFDSTIDNLLGGGGWVVRNRKDVHMEAYERQRFRFRKEDQTSRKTVVAQDSDRNLYFLVFENGFNFHMVARTFIKEQIFAQVRDVFFLDGGSSSAIV
ncbi:MAG: phosphodiester glycosidase family protein, partial [Candidatus Riflebacteria bacterium]|nr:phosphodiester glycosidase family protein [Candidatus Riflebacteria bacterium]